MPEALHRMDEDSVRAYREHDGEVSDEVDAARDRESEEGRESVSPAFEGLLSWPSLLAFCIVATALIAAFWPHK